METKMGGREVTAVVSAAVAKKTRSKRKGSEGIDSSIVVTQVRQPTAKEAAKARENMMITAARKMLLGAVKPSWRLVKLFKCFGGYTCVEQLIEDHLGEMWDYKNEGPLPSEAWETEEVSCYYDDGDYDEEEKRKAFVWMMEQMNAGEDVMELLLKVGEKSLAQDMKDYIEDGEQGPMR